MAKTLAVLQGGGPTAVINATLAAIAERASDRFDHLIGLPHSFEGASRSEKAAIDLSSLIAVDGEHKRSQLAATPGSLLGSSRKRVETPDLERALETLGHHDCHALIGIGGNGTMAALSMLADHATATDYELTIIGAPKTVDNDLPGAYVAPGYGSAARFVAQSVRDFDCDFCAMSTFDDVTILETMGRTSGWLAASSSLLVIDGGLPPLVLIPEVAIDLSHLFDEIARRHDLNGRVFVVVNEMLTDRDGMVIGEAFQQGPTDSLGRHMYSLSLGTGNYLADQIWRKLGLQTRCLRPGNLGRASSATVSQPDRALAVSVGCAAVDAVCDSSSHAAMVTVEEDLSHARIDFRDLTTKSRGLPANFYDASTYSPTDDFIAYARPLLGSVDPILTLSDI